jgi:endoplasmic reticulum-Golgi intermediate compartment protein 3
LYVNTTRANQLHFSFDISFHNIPCNLLSLDIVDDIGGVVKDTKHDIYKHRLTSLGDKEGLPEEHNLGNTLLSEENILKTSLTSDVIQKELKCGNCYGSMPIGECCNTCESVRIGYGKMGWKFKPHEIEQCQRELFAETLREQFSDTGGCQIYGKMELNKASGHIHIVPHANGFQGVKAPSNGVLNLLELLSFTFQQFNITHTINSLSFGDHFPGIKSPLDGEYRNVGDTHGMYQYYVKIVPTRYKKIDGYEIESNQYSVTEHLRHLSPGSGRGMPGVYFYYQLSPLQAQYEEKRPSIFRFFTSACALVGGCFTVMGIVDLIVSTFMHCFKKTIL